MRLIDVYSAKALAAYFTHAHSNDRPYLGLTLFPRKKKDGIGFKMDQRDIRGCLYH